MSLLDEALNTLRARQPTARAIGVELIGIVGSVARGEDRPDSDVDVVYARIGSPSLFELGGLMADLEDHLGRRVDLVNLHTVRPRTRARMEQDLVRA